MELPSPSIWPNNTATRKINDALVREKSLHNECEDLIKLFVSMTDSCNVVLMVTDFLQRKTQLADLSEEPAFEKPPSQPWLSLTW
jgi:hypothetical protein